MLPVPGIFIALVSCCGCASGGESRFIKTTRHSRPRCGFGERSYQGSCGRPGVRGERDLGDTVRGRSLRVSTSDHRAGYPITNFEREQSGRVAIGLTARNTRWAQNGFQFAHEFCHALANFSDNPRRSVRYPRHANSWQESLCEMASLFTLRAMSRSWGIAPPYPAWKNYAPWLNHYAEQRLAQPGTTSPRDVIPDLVQAERARPPSEPGGRDETPSLRCSFCLCSRQTHADGRHWYSSIAEPAEAMRRSPNVWWSGDPGAPRTSVPSSTGLRESFGVKV